MTTDVGALQLLDGVEDADPAGGCAFAPREYDPWTDSRTDSRTDRWAKSPATPWTDSPADSWTGSWTGGSCRDERV
jgi:hypothetical protein